MPTARNDDHFADQDPNLELTPPQRLRALAELLAIGLRRLHERPRDAPSSGPVLGPLPAPLPIPEESSEFRTNELA